MREKSLTPAQDEIEVRRKREEIELCGKNRGPHDYMPIEWTSKIDNETALTIERVTRLICRVCFNNVNVSTLIASYKEINF